MNLQQRECEPVNRARGPSVCRFITSRCATLYPFASVLGRDGESTIFLYSYSLYFCDLKLRKDYGIKCILWLFSEKTGLPLDCPELLLHENRDFIKNKFIDH